MKLTYRPKIVGLFTIVVLLILIFFGGAHFHKDQIWPFGQGYYLVIKDIKKYGINYKEEKRKIAEEKRKIAEEKKRKIAEEKKRKAAEKRKAERKRKADELKKFDVCNISKSYNVKDNSHAFIGHAYGAPGWHNGFISPDVEKFIRENSTKLSNLIFTGDVFSRSSLDLWKRLRFVAGEGVNILVARGNHDNHEILKKSEFGQHPFPLLRTLDDIPLIVDDSPSSEWLVSNSTIELANEVQSNQVIIARHNMPTKNLLRFANSHDGLSSKLPRVEDLVKRFDKNKIYYWIIGDSGATGHLPRLSCLKHKNHIFLTNGLGQVEGDSIILLHNKELSEYVISSEVIKIETLK